MNPVPRAAAAPEAASAPKVRVVVLNWNSAWFTRRCLTALARTEYPEGRMEVVVVDNASFDGSFERIRSEFPEVRYVRNEENLGFAEGCNRAMRDLAGARYVALVNNDAVPEPDWLQPLVDALEADPAAGAAAARLVLEPAFSALDLRLDGGSAVLSSVRLGEIEVLGRCITSGLRGVGRPAWPMTVDHHLDDSATLMVPVGRAGGTITVAAAGDGVLTASTETGSDQVVLTQTGSTLAIPAGGDRVELLNGLGTSLTAAGEGFDRLYGEPVGAEGPDSVSAVDGFCGGGVLLRSAMLSEVGLFDPGFFAYYEDTDLSWRARRAGWRTLGVPRSTIRHAFGGSAGSKARGFFFLNYRNWLLTSLRNASPEGRRSTLRLLAERVTWAVRANVLSPLKHRRRPDFVLIGEWARVLGAVVAASVTNRVTGRSRRPGSVRTGRVRSRLQPAPSPRSPSPRPGGALVVHVVLDHGSSGRAMGMLAAGLGPAFPDIDAVAVLASPTSPSGFRLASAEEWALLLAGTPIEAPVGGAGAVDRRLELVAFPPGSVVLGSPGSVPSSVVAVDLTALLGAVEFDPEAFAASIDSVELVGAALLERFGTP